MPDDIKSNFWKALSELQDLSNKISDDYPEIEISLFDINKTCDPDVKILLQSFALLYAKIQDDIKFNASELLQSLIYLLDPGLTTFTPPVAIVQLKIQKPCTIIHDTSVSVTSNSKEYEFKVIGDHNVYPLKIYDVHVMNMSDLIKDSRYGISFSIISETNINEMVLYLNLNHKQAAELLGHIFKQKKVSIFSVESKTIIGDVYLYDVSPIFTNECNSPYHHLYNHNCSPMLYQRIKITFINTIQSNEAVTVCIPIHTTESIKIDENTLIPNVIPMVNLYAQTAKPIDVDVPQQKYRILLENNSDNIKRIHSVPSMSIYNQDTQEIQQYTASDLVYFASYNHEINKFYITLSKEKIDWFKLRNSIIYVNTLCSDNSSMLPADKIKIRNISGDVQYVAQPSMLKNLHIDNIWTAHAILNQKIYSLSDNDLLKRIIALCEVYNMDLSDTFLDISTANEYVIHKSKSLHLTLVPKKVINIRVNHNMANFIKYFVISKTLINLADLNSIFQINFIDTNNSTVYSEEEEYAIREY